jgi:hypothetical protein
MVLSDIPKLLDELCVKLDICLSPGDRAKIAIRQFRDIDSFEAAVLRAEGLDPLAMDRRLRHDIRMCISRYLE